MLFPGSSGLPVLFSSIGKVPWLVQLEGKRLDSIDLPLHKNLKRTKSNVDTSNTNPVVWYPTHAYNYITLAVVVVVSWCPPCFKHLFMLKDLVRIISFL